MKDFERLLWKEEVVPRHCSSPRPTQLRDVSCRSWLLFTAAM